MKDVFGNGCAFTTNNQGQKVDEEGFKTTSFTKRKPISFSCVSVKKEGGRLLVRSTRDPNKTTLSFDKDEWDAFTKGIREGELNFDEL
ncbi:MAG: hypothetical protein A2747_01835 [Candidatus Yonathbacteria bacterium RIFCSPHIGHO2_01_FULL_44_41]|uniref:DUF397 domain-containing protein n=1 Tax=Candidatus Yonathbacteria bacterium RIFCSPHIGHO2_02_FULL_44_14 TaxID=1802724 RepID=A0A1G2S915_9BACT|nr:MAG: hypothetical protein A2747_01835 [Candidatus Yonathbacteria bacterium RIFCSPHIGHO2_01_FULL_44_41]OHA81603.1 MAG: hypothetical protein A3D51_02410 [Candidatus Yonathbacteria bacterium RIFCSPHIGHO2_02_FULL_44_14]OHA81784.1 MAG: hypothetical protein A3B06_02345 [Candidatus Yonathbacteria bacterium RIFCSPLOWO2_01_FULL_43_20]